MRFSAVVHVAVVAVMLDVLGGGCSLSGEDGRSADGSRTVHLEDAGPLSATTGNDRFSMIGPEGVVPWSATYGSLVLCKTRPGTLTVTGVRSDFAPKPVADHWLLRTMAPDVAESEGSLTYETALGTAPKFSEPYAEGRPDNGKYSDISGQDIAAQCSRPMKEGYQELVLALTTNSIGAKVSDTFVDYTFDGKPYALHIVSDYVLCGSDPSLEADCARLREP